MTAGEKAFGVIQGIPLDKNNFAPRVAIAWDPWGNGKTVIRAGFGLFYDHPPLALAFLANAFDGAASTLLESAGGSPCVLTALGCSVDNPFNFTALNATNVFQGLLTGTLASCSTSVPSMCFQPNSAAIRSAVHEFAFHQSELFDGKWRARISAAVHSFHDSGAEEFSIRLRGAGKSDDRARVGQKLEVERRDTTTHTACISTIRAISTSRIQKLLASNDNNAVLSGFVAPLTNPITISVPSTARMPNHAGGGSIAVSVPGILAPHFRSATRLAARRRLEPSVRPRFSISSGHRGRILLSRGSSAAMQTLLALAALSWISAR